MLFMVMHKMTPELENGLPPNPDVVQNMGKLVTEAREKGIHPGRLDQRSDDVDRGVTRTSSATSRSRCE
jgi:hypothetical protein